MTVIPHWYGQDRFDIYAQAAGCRCPCLGWQTTVRCSTSDGRWRCYKIHTKVDPNGSNGISEAWIDGKKILLNKNVDFGTIPGWAWFQIGSNQATPNNGRCMAVDFDYIAVSDTGYIGPIPGTIPPNHPTGLNIKP